MLVELRKWMWVFGRFVGWGLLNFLILIVVLLVVIDVFVVL